MWEDITPANIANVLFANSNLQTVGATVTARPREDLLLKLRYANLMHAKKSNAWLTNSYVTGFSPAGSEIDLGNEIDFDTVYDYTEDVQVGLLLDTFLPGDFFKANSNKDPAFQAIASLKVAF